MTEQANQQVANTEPKVDPKATVQETPFVGDFQGTDITEDTRTQEIVPFPVEEMYKEYKSGKRTSPFPVAYTSLMAVRPYIKKDEWSLLPGEVLDEGAKKPRVEQVTPESLRWVLEIHFVSKDGVYQHVHTVFDIQPDHKNPVAARKGTSEFFAHLWNAFSLKNNAGEVLSSANLVKVLGRPIGSWKDNFEAIARVFNTGGSGNSPIFMADGQPLPIRIKLVYSPKGRVELPMYGNKVERVIQGMTASTLVVGEKDRMTRPEKPSDGLASPIEPTDGGEPDWDNL